MMSIRHTFFRPDDDPAPAKDIYAPLTRKEMIQSGKDITPLNREEYFLKKQVEPIVFHVEPTNPENPLGGGTIKESPDFIRASVGRNAVMEILGADEVGLRVNVQWFTGADPILSGMLVFSAGDNRVLLDIMGDTTGASSPYSVTITAYSLTPVS